MITSILPGVKVEVLAGNRSATSTVTGVVTMPLALSWGNTVTAIYKGDDTLTTLGYKLSNVKMKLINEIMNYANELILYRTNAGVKATGTLTTGIIATAKYGGVRGNDISITITESGTKWTIKTYLDAVEMDSQIVTDASKFTANDFVTIAGTGTLAAVTVALTGGADGTEASIDTYTAEIEKHDYNILIYTGTDLTTATAIKKFVLEERMNGRMVQGVLNGVAADNKSIYNSTVGGFTSDYELTAAEACATMGAILARCGISSSATYYDVIGWTDVSPKLNKIQQETKTQNGEILFTNMYGAVKVLYDINSLTTYTDDNPEDFHKGLVVRTLDKYAADIQKLLDTKAIGKIRNSVSGRNQIKGMVFEITTSNYLNPGYIENFTADDVTIAEGTSRDSVTVTVGIKVVDTVDKIYVTVTAL